MFHSPDACGLCGKLFLYSYNVTAHIKHVHYKEKRPCTSEERLTCYVCYEKFPRVWKLNEHLETVHDIVATVEGTETVINETLTEATILTL